MTLPISYEDKPIRELYIIAKNAKIQGWHHLRKRQLISALTDWEMRVDSNLLQTVLSESEATLQKMLYEESFLQSSRNASKTSKSEHFHQSDNSEAQTRDKEFDENNFGKNQNAFGGTSEISKNNNDNASAALPNENAFQDSSSKSILQSEPLSKPERLLESGQSQESKPSSDLKQDLTSKSKEGFPNSPETDESSKISELKQRLMLHKTLGTSSKYIGRKANDQLLLMVRDPFWLHAYWEVSSELVERIRAAMGPLWHTSDPVLRLFKVSTDTIGNIRREYLSDIRIHGGINNWYIDVNDPPCSFMVEIGYLARDNQFFNLITSNIVETPQCYVHDAFGHPDVSWMGVPSDFCAGYFTGSQQHFENFIESPETQKESFGFSSAPVSIVPFKEVKRNFDLDVDAEIVIRGQTEPGVQLNIKGEAIRLKEDGSFSIRYHLPERRHVYPIVAVSPDGIETQTVILAIERNTKVLETVLKDDEDE